MWNPVVSPAQSQSQSPSNQPVPSNGAETDREYLRRIARGEQNPIVLILGQSSSGKSTLVDTLDFELGIVSATRLLPRQLRAGDTAGDRAWTEQKPAVGGENEVDRFASRSIIFSDHKYQGYYGFPGRDVVTNVKTADGTSLIVGRCVEVAPAIEACQNLFPAVPIVTVRLSVPESILAERLATRPEAHPGEHQERQKAILEFAEQDSRQLGYLAQIYGLHSIMSLSDSEAARLPARPGQIRMTLTDVPRVFSELIGAAKKESARLATDILEPRLLDYSDIAVPDALIDVLDNKVAPAARREGLKICLKGGLAAALYAKSPRPVSLDIDFTIRETPSSEAQMGLLLHAITGKPGEVQDHWAKKTYNVRGIHAVAQSEKYGKEVELDALVKTRVQISGSLFRYEFPLDALDQFYCRTVTLPSGQSVFLVPPEQLIIEKLAAGRGAELGKFDLYDVAGVISQIPLNPALFRKFIDSQRFTPESNPEVVAIFGGQPTLLTKAALDRLNITDPGTMAAALTLGETLHIGSVPDTPHSDKALTADVLMRLVLVRHLQNSISRLLASLDQPITLQTEQSTISKQFGELEVAGPLNRLGSLLEYYEKFELGRRDLYVRRPGPNQDLRDLYFTKLAEQRTRLSRNGHSQL